MKTQLVVLVAILSTTSLVWSGPSDLPTFTLTNGDVLRASITIDSKTGTDLVLYPRPGKMAELAQLTKENLGKHIRMVIAGKVSEPIVQSEISPKAYSHSMHVSSPEEALAIVKALLIEKTQ